MATRHSDKPRPGWWAWVVWTLCVAPLAATFILDLLRESSPADNDWPVLIAISVFVASYATIGALVTSRERRNVLGWLAAGCALMFSMASFGLVYADEGRSAQLSGAPLLLSLSQWQWLAGIVLGGPFLILFFPRGALLSRRWRPAAAALGAGLAAVVMSIGFKPGDLPDTNVENPLGIEGADAILGVLGGVGGILLVLGSLASIVSLIVRFRRAEMTERQQMKWFVSAIVAAMTIALGIGFPMEALGYYEASNFIVTAALCIIPISIGVAVLTRRFYDIDVVINKTLVYTVLTAILGGCYLALVFLLQRVTNSFAPDSDLAVAGSTLAVAALFGPLRGRVQGFIDRRFYRRRYDASRALREFNSRLRDEVDLAAVNREILSVVDETVGPQHAAVWLQPKTLAAVGAGASKSDD